MSAMMPYLTVLTLVIFDRYVDFGCTTLIASKVDEASYIFYRAIFMFVKYIETQYYGARLSEIRFLFPPAD